MWWGAHESIQGGFHRAVERAAEDGCRSLQIFTKPPAIWKSPPILPEQVELFRARRQEMGIGPVLVHDSYLINPCAPNAATRRKSWAALADEAGKCDLLGAEFLVLHPGSPGDLGEAEGIRLAAACLEEALGASEAVCILIESTAGQGKSIGHRFEQIAAIIDGAGGGPRLGVCFDTCHSFAAGYALADAESAGRVFEEFDAVVGAERLRAFHINDSKKPLGSRVDRHEFIGKGEIGLGLFSYLAREPRFASLPGVLETPIVKGQTYGPEVALLRKLSAH